MTFDGGHPHGKFYDEQIFWNTIELFIKACACRSANYSQKKITRKEIILIFKNAWSTKLKKQITTLVVLREIAYTFYTRLV